jgi:hypothetical protein
MILRAHGGSSSARTVSCWPRGLRVGATPEVMAPEVNPPRAPVLQAFRHSVRLAREIRVPRLEPRVPRRELDSAARREQKLEP